MQFSEQQIYKVYKNCSHNERLLMIADVTFCELRASSVIPDCVHEYPDPSCHCCCAELVRRGVIELVHHDNHPTENRNAG